ncbi:hypothetical protein ACRALDRAFT_2042598 [Sodiomyces alcalophilus JCM 7366]|uniref:uncharacterized protein n=1 Tax=Sodiomyces alcalophilus JCM 7366 TaxID=591952 RepID=UPI0039B5A3BC
MVADVGNAAKAPSTSSSEAPPPGQPDNGRELAINVNRSQCLTMQGGALILDRNPTRPNKPPRVCGLPLPEKPSHKTIIPLHNVLWAERSGPNIDITYAEPLPRSKHRLRPATLIVDGSATGDAEVDSWIQTLMARAYGAAKTRKRVKVLVNPHAGPGGAMAKWERDVAPLFRAARMTVDVQQTTRTGEAVDIVRDLALDHLDAIIACSGDGLPHEIFNGLGARPDAGRALRTIAVGQIPCGSGNAMACNLCGSHHPSEAALAIIKGVDTPLDLMSITYGDERKLSFLSQTLGIMAEADLATEHLRWMGSLRFQHGFLTRVFKKKSYPCDLAVRVAMDDLDEIRSHYKALMDSAVVPGPEQPGTDSPENNGLPALRYGTVKDELDDQWETLRYDNMGTLYAGKMAYLAPDANFFPASHPSDGLFDLVTVDSDLSFMTVVDLMGAVADDGGFFGNPKVKYRKLHALRVTPRHQDAGYISVDGESIPFGPLQIEVHPRLGKVYSKSGVYEASGPKGWKEAV